MTRPKNSLALVLINFFLLLAVYIPNASSSGTPGINRFIHISHSGEKTVYDLNQPVSEKTLSVVNADNFKADNLLASRVIGETALLSDVPVRMSEIHGMAQRGGVVESAIVFGDAESTIISDGEADLLVGFEPAETLRALNKCNAGTKVITNLSPLSPFTVTIGKAVYPDMKKLQELIRAKTGKLITFDATALAREAGNVMSVNMVLLGAMAQTGVLPLSTDNFKEAICTKTKKAFVDANLKAFDLGFEAAEAVK